MDSEDAPPQRPRPIPGRRPGRFGRSARVGGRFRVIMLGGVVAFFVVFDAVGWGHVILPAYL